MNQGWDTLLATALMGTDRQTPDFSGLDGSLGDLLSQLDAQDLEGQVLSAAGAIASATQAGIEPQTQPLPTLDPCDWDDMPQCNERVQQILQTILNGDYAPALSELLSYLETAGQRISFASLPTMLDFGRSRSQYRDAIRIVIGKRGRWLAQLNPTWAYIHAELNGFDSHGEIQIDVLQEEWETGTQATRLELLKTLRHHAPSQALSFLSATWKQEKAKERAAFLDVLQVGLTADDETFLEAALDDRSKEVRAIAANLLSCLPTSQFCVRMSERFQNYIQVETTSKGVSLTITLPENDEPRDGLIADNLKALGRRSSLLQQIISAVPLHLWDAEPDDLILAACQQDWKAPLLGGWIMAAQRQQNLDWAKALITHAVQREKEPTHHLATLWELLPQSEREERWKDWFARLWTQNQWAEWREDLGGMVTANPQPSLSFSQYLVTGVKRDLQVNQKSKKKHYPYHWRSMMDILAYYLHPDSLPDIQEMATDMMEQKLDGYRQDFLDGLLEIMTFRHDLRRIFGPD